MAGRANSKMKARRTGRCVNEKGNDKSEDDYDISHLQKPFISNMNNLKKLIKLNQNATPEVPSSHNRIVINIFNTFKF